MKTRFLILALVLLTSSCAHRPRVHPNAKAVLGYSYLMKQRRAPETPEQKARRIKMLQAASGLVGHSQIVLDGKDYREDCSGLIRAVLGHTGAPIRAQQEYDDENDVTTLYRFVDEHGRIFGDGPEPGDLVFFHHTYELGDRGAYFPLSHIGVVEKIDSEGTVTFVHYMGKTVIRSRMNLKNPVAQFDPKTRGRINHMLRRNIAGYPGFTTAELFAGFGQLM